MGGMKQLAMDVAQARREGEFDGMMRGYKDMMINIAADFVQSVEPGEGVRILLFCAAHGVTDDPDKVEKLIERWREAIGPIDGAR